MDFDRAAQIARQVIERLLGSAAPPGTDTAAGQIVPLVNMNIPALCPGVPKGVRVVRQSTQLMQDRYVSHAGPDGVDHVPQLGDG